LFVSQIHDSSLVRLVLQQIPRNILARIGIDFSTPRATADRLLRTAANLEPVHYWAHFWLGYSLYYSGDIDGAEMAFNTCISLRPEYLLGYTERCQVQLTHIERFELAKERLRPGVANQVEQLAVAGLGGMFGGSPLSQAFRLHLVAQETARVVNLAETEKAQAELKKRMLRGILQAADRDPLDPVVQWVLGLSLDWSGRYEEARNAYLAASELEAARRLFDPNWELIDIDIAAQMRRIIDARAKTFPHDPKMRASSAAIYLAQNDDTRAQSLAGALWPPMDQAVQGVLFFRRKEYDKAAKAFGDVLARSKPLATPVNSAIDPDERIRFRYRPGYALAAIGRARAREALGKPDETLTAFTELTQKARPDLPEWQRLEGYVGQARLFAALGQETEARQSLEDLRQLDTALAQSISSQLFPPTK
jgi:tetratricopeptide (TPR) repeat protein